MIAARQIAFGKAAGAAKPYKARLEYLESTGTQYIETGIIPDADTGMKIVADKPINTADVYIAGLRNSTANTRWCIGWSRNALWYCGYNITIQSQVDGEQAEVTLNFRNTKTFTVGDVYSDNLPTLGFEPAYNIRLFGSAGVVSSYTAASVKIRSAQISQDTSIVRSFIPVLDNDLVPCMYDEVSGEFFYNQGEGEFIAGPVVDDVDYTARDYIQDGLVAMWDGIENAGWGTHDANATVWKDLSGNGNDLTQTGTVNTTWENDACVFDKNRGMGMSSFPVAKDAVLSKNWTLEVVFSVASTENLNGSLFGLGNTKERVLWVYANATTTIISALYQNTTGIPIGENSLNQVNHLAVTGDGRVYVNGEFYTQRISATEEPDETYFNIGFLPQFKDYMIGKINAIRFGGENLTAEEIAYNYSIDKARFGL